MIAYKGFRPGLICRGYQFVMGLNTTEKANCRENGFHCAENPLDCLSYYSSLEHSEYYIVNAGGDIDEDEHDSKIACTELTVIKRLTKEELFLHGLAYMVDHPRRVWSSHVAANRAMANCGYAVVRGKDPVATGRLGDILAFAKEAPDSESIVQVAVGQEPTIGVCINSEICAGFPEAPVLIVGLVHMMDGSMEKRCQLWNRRNFDAQGWSTGFGSRKVLTRKNIWQCLNGYRKWSRSAR